MKSCRALLCAVLVVLIHVMLPSGCVVIVEPFETGGFQIGIEEDPDADQKDEGPDACAGRDSGCDARPDADQEDESHEACVDHDPGCLGSDLVYPRCQDGHVVDCLVACDPVCGCSGVEQRVETCANGCQGWGADTACEQREDAVSCEQLEAELMFAAQSLSSDLLRCADDLDCALWEPHLSCGGAASVTLCPTAIRADSEAQASAEVEVRSSAACERLGPEGCFASASCAPLAAVCDQGICRAVPAQEAPDCPDPGCAAEPWAMGGGTTCVGGDVVGCALACHPGACGCNGVLQVVASCAGACVISDAGAECL